MSRWKEKLDNHPIHETLAWLRDHISAEFDDLDENEISEKRRLLKIVSLYEEALQKIDPEIIPYNQLDSLNTQLRHQNISSQITAYKSNGNVAHLTAVNDHIAGQLTQLSLLMSLAQNYTYESPSSEFEGLIDNISSTLVKKKDALSTLLENITESSKKSENEIANLSEAIKQKKQDAESLMSEWQQQFSTAQESRSQNFMEWREKFSEERAYEIDEIKSTYKEKLAEKEIEYTENLTELLLDSKDKHQSILDLYELTAGDSVGAGYLKNAKEEKEQADKWRLISIFFIVCTVSWLLFSYNSNFNKNKISQIEPKQTIVDIKEKKDLPIVDKGESKNKNHTVNFSREPVKSLPMNNGLLWFKLITTFSISGVLLWGSAYSAQQSTSHRNNEKRNRRFALEMKAFDPFISTLDEEVKKEMKKQLCDKIFGQSIECDESNPKVIDEHALKTVADTLGNLLSKIPR